jgi:S1-C subfamily serine protease
MYECGLGVPVDFVQAYKFYVLAAAQGLPVAVTWRDGLALRMTAPQISQGQSLAREFKPHKESGDRLSGPGAAIADTHPIAGGTGFFITDDGFLVTAAHVINGALQIRLLTSSGEIKARLVAKDSANDVALLKTEGHFSALPVASSRMVKLGNAVVTIGFPNTGLQGFSPKLAKGEIAGLSGAQDDPHYFQISVPVQPGNSGGALADERGNVIGVVAAKLNAAAALSTSGVLPENVNYAVKSSFLLSFLESVPEISAKFKEAQTNDRKFEDVVKSVKDATVLVLVY